MTDQQKRANAKNAADSDDEASFRPGAYQIQVHVIEARDIKAENPAPKVVVDVMDKPKSTPTHKGTFSPFFDHVLFWELPDMTLDHFEYGKINISLFDTHTALRAKVIGSYEFDVMMVYSQPNHEIYKTWIALTDPTDEKEGVRAMVKISVSVLGPNDTPVHHDEKADGDDTGPILMPPRMATEDHIFVLQIHRAEHLPKVDTGLMGGTIDPYVVVSFAGVETKTHTLENSQNPIFCDQLELPVTMPCMSERIIITLMDKDKIGSDDIVATTRLRFSTVPRLVEGTDVPKPRPGGGHQPMPERALTRWINLYGPRDALENDAAMKMRNGLDEGSTYIGRLLISAWEMKQSDPKLAVKKINTETPPADEKWTVRVNVLQGAQLPFADDGVCIEMSWANVSVSSSKKKGKSGTVVWNEMVDMEAQVSAKNLPDLFLYLKYGEKRIGYIRYDVRKLEKEMRLTVPVWDDLEVDPCYDEIKKYTSAGEILFSLHIAPTKDIGERPPLLRPSFMPCSLYCYLYAAKELPALDTQSGSMDPYVVINFCGVSTKFSTKPNSLFPIWNEIKKLDVNVIHPMEIAPKINCLVYDADQLGSDEFAGLFQVDVSQLSNENTKIPPQWFDLTKKGKKTRGSVLCGFDLVPLTVTFTPLKSITPASVNRTLEFTIIGLRNLAPYNFLKVTKPYLECKIYDKTYKSKKYSKPSGTNPNFLEMVSLPLTLPIDALFAEPLQIDIFEDRILGKTKIATCVIPLAQYYDSTAKKHSAFVARSHLENDAEDDVLADAKAAVQSAAKTEIGDEAEKQSLLGNTQLQSDAPPSPKPSTSESGPSKSTLSVPQPASARTAASSTLSTATEPETAKAAHEEEASAAYMEGRETVKKELEKTFKLLPFHSEPLLRYSSYDKPPKVVGAMKCNLFLLPQNAPANLPRPFSHAEFAQPRHYLVRVYIIRGIKLNAKDENGLSDPCLEVSLGRTKIFDPESLRPRTIDPEFHCSYEMNCILPGQSQLTVTVYDKDSMGYEVIGKTEIDLENYFFSEEWHKYAKKPLEKRTLKSDLTPTPQGTLEMWVDILDPRLKATTPMTNIDPPPKVPFEMRVVIWKASGIPYGDYGNLSDMFISVELSGSGKSQKQDTDVHWRATDGKGSFNYRLIFDIELPMKQPRLKFQVWDQDIIGPNDALGEATIGTKTLQRAMVAAYRANNSSWLHLDKNADPVKQEPQAEWIKFTTPENSGKVLVTVEFVPKELAVRKPAGPARQDPNSNPYLPPPMRVEWDFFRPHKLLAKLLGPVFSARLRNLVCCLFCCFLLVVLMYPLGQFASIVSMFK